MKQYALVLIVLYTVAVNAVPIDQNSGRKCAKECSGLNTKFNYQTGHVYDYKYESETKIQLSGSSKMDTNIRMQSDVLVTVLAPCEFALQLRNVQFDGTGETAPEMVAELERRPVRFAFDDGEIKSICPTSEEEPAWALNLKRGILSTFQNAMSGSDDNARVLESDVTGRCPTVYEMKEEGPTTKTFYKTKNLISCSAHRGNFSALRGASFNTGSDVQGLPLVDSKQQCRHSIRRQILTEASCTETHVFRPFKDQKSNGVLSVTNQKLHFISDNAAANKDIAAPVNHKALLFDHADVFKMDTAQALMSARESLQKLCESSDDEVRPETPGQFTELVYNLRKLNDADMAQLYSTAKAGAACPKQMKFFLDALPMIGTPESVKQMVNIMSEQQLSAAERQLWTTSLAFVPKVNKQMLQAVLPLLQDQSIAGKELLGISSLVHTYINQHPHGQQESEVVEAVEKLVSRLGSKCQATSADQIQEALMILKAIGNIGSVPSIVNSLSQCFAEKSNAMEVRVNAIKALRRVPCQNQKQQLLPIYSSTSEDAEIRITAFLQLLRCADREVLQQIKTVHEIEKNTQVGSFVWSYAEQIQSSSSPLKQELKDQLRDIQLSNKFQKDPRKFSNYREVSAFWNRLNLGGSAEGAMIFSQESFVPRQAFLNLSIDLFGTNVNLLEVGSRVEGLDKTLEKMFGPEGYFKNQYKYYERNDNPFKPHKNQRIQQFQDKVGHRRSEQKLALSMYLRLFGDDLLYYSIRDKDLTEDLDTTFDLGMQLEKLARRREISVARNVIFLDSKLAIPTGTGFPIRIEVIGTASVNLETSTKFDVQKLMQLGNPANAEIECKLKPSAAIRIAAKVSVVSGNSHSGIELVTQAHSSTKLDTQLIIRNGQMVNAKLNVPMNKMEIIDIQTQLFSIKANKPQEEEGVVENRFHGKLCTPKRFNKLVGLQLCSELSYANASLIADAPFFPLTGPARFAVVLEKADPGLSSYELNAELKNTESKKYGKLSFNTPGSSVDREIVGEFEYSAGRQLNLRLKSPLKNFKIEGKVDRRDDKVDAKLSAIVDDQRTYQVSANAEHQLLDDDLHKYTMQAKFSTPESGPKTIHGSVQYQKQRLLKVDVSLDKVYEKKVFARGNLYLRDSQGKSELEVDGHFELPWFRLKQELKHSQSKDCSRDYSVCEMENKFWIEYQNVNGGQPNRLTLNNRLEFDHSEPQTFATASSHVQFSRYPHRNLFVKYNLKKTEMLLEQNLQLTAGEDSANEHKRLTIEQIWRKLDDSAEQVVELLMKQPSKNMNYHTKLTYENHFPKQFKAALEFLEKNQRKLEGELSLRMKEGPLYDVNAEAKLKFNDRHYRLYKELKEKSPKEYKSVSIIQWGNHEQAKLDTDLKLKSEANVFDYELNAKLELPQRKPLVVYNHLKRSPQEARIGAKIQKGDELVYDIFMDLLEKSPKKKQLTAHAVSSSFDYSLDASHSSQEDAFETEFTAKKQKQVFAKGFLTIPRNLAPANNEKLLRANVHWDLNAAEEKNVLLQAKYFSQSEHKQWDLLAKVKTPTLDYKVSSTTWKNMMYKTNTTITRNGDEMLKLNIGCIHQGKLYALRQLSFDYELATMEPMVPRHTSGLISAVRRGIDVDVNGHFENHLRGSKASFELTAANEISGQTVVSKHVGKLRCRDAEDGSDNVWGLESALKWENNGPKRFSGELNHGAQRPLRYELDWNQPAPGQFEVEFELETPLEQLKQIEVKLATKQEEDDHDHSLVIKMNKDQNLRAMFKGSLGWQNTDISTSLETPYASLRKFESNFVQQPNRARLSLEWNRENVLKVYREIVDGDSARRELKAGVEAKIPGKLDWNVDMRGSQSGDSNYDLTGSASIDGKDYKVKGETDLEQPKLSLVLQAPSGPELKLQALCTEKGKCSLKVQKDHEQTLTVLIDYRWQENDRHAFVTVKDVAQPFSVKYQSSSDSGYRLLSANRYQLVYEIISDLETPEKNTYGVRLNKANGECKFELQYPARTIVLRSKQDNQLPTSIQQIIEFSLNSKDVSKTSKLEVTYTNRQQGVYVTELVLANPALPHPIKLQSQVRAFGLLSSADTEKTLESQLKVQYSADSQKELLVKHRLAYKPGKQVDLQIQAQQPSSKLDIKWFHTNDYETSLYRHGIQFRNQKNEQQQYAVELRQIGEGFKFDLVNPINHWSCEVRRSSKSSQNGAEYVATISQNNNQVYEISARADNEEKVIKFDIHSLKNQRQTVFHASAHLLSRDVASLKIWHTEDGQRVNDIELLLSVDERSIMKTKAFIRPKLNEELKIASKNTFGVASRVKYQQEMAELQDAIIVPEEKIVEELAATVRPLLQQLRDEFRTVTQELRTSSRLSEAKMYLGQFYGKWMNMLSQVTADIARALDNIIDYTANDHIRNYYAKTKTYLNSLQESLPQRYQDVNDAVRQAYIGLLNAVATTLEAIVKPVNDLIVQLGANEMVVRVQGAYNDMLYTNVYDRVKQYIGQWWNSFNELKLEKLIANYSNQARQSLQQYLNSAQQYFSQLYNEWYQDEDFRPMLDAAREAFQKAQWSYNYYETEQKVKSFVDWLYRELSQSDLTNPESLRKYWPVSKVNDPETGRYEWETRLPFKLVHFQDIVDWLNLNWRSFQTSVGRLQQNIQNQFLDFQPSDLTDDVLPSMSESLTELPPYEKTAFLVGDQHFITFDQNSYDFAGACSYLLARDFDAGRFTITVQYEKRDGRTRRRSILVEVDETQVEIFHDAKVLIDNTEVQLPQYRDAAELSVLRLDHRISLQTASGLNVTCDTFHHHCFVRLPSWAHAQSAGLLGVNDDEPSNDLRLPDGSQMTSAGQLASAWQVSSDCEMQENTETAMLSEGHEMASVCNQYFRSRSSLFRSCFKHVNPTPFFSMCLVDMQQQVSRYEAEMHELGLCNVSSAYITACQIKGIELQTPKQCIRCDDVGHGSLKLEQTRTIEAADAPRSADVVFLINMRNSLQLDQPGQKLAQLAEAIEHKFQGIGYSNLRFGLMGFGGANVHGAPHFHSANGRLLFNTDGLRQTVDWMQMTSESEEKDVDPLAAVQFMATNFPFRAGVKKIAILVKASSCDGNKVDYYDVQSKLLERGINLHMITEESFEFQDNERQEIIGVDAQTVYSVEDTQETSTKKTNVRKQMVAPHDSCSVLAQESNGTVFELEAFTKHTSKFCKVLAHRVVERAQTRVAQLCECQEYNGAPRTVCFAKEIPRPMSLVSSDSFFNIHYIKPLRSLKKNIKQSASDAFSWL